MSTVLTAAQMRAIEQTAIDAGEATGLELMERAGRGAVEAILQHWPDLATGPQSALVLCGPGNNGGDGFVVARRLRDRGWDVEVLLYGDPGRMPPDARTNYDVWCGMGEVAPLTVEAAGRGKRPTLLVDAMFGTGLNRAIPLDCANAWHAVEQRDVGDTHPWLVPFHRVALDCPSGLDSDSGQFLMPPAPDEEKVGMAARWKWWTDDAARRLLHVDLTLSFHRAKVGHYQGEPLYDLRIVDIGLGPDDRHPAHLTQPAAPETIRVLDFDPPKGRSSPAWPGMDLDKRRHQGHKFSHGHAVVLSGGVGRGGAARLAARAALRVGAGLVTVGCPPAALIENAARLDAIMLRSMADDAALTEMLGDPRITALCLGPGLGLKEREAALVRTALTAPGGDGEARPLVLDADALTLLAQDQSLFDALHPGCVLTPHAGEFARLFPDIARRLGEEPTSGPAYSKVDATRDAAARAGCVVLYKGADTVIAAPSGACSINAALYDRAAPWLATAGSGDVLAGLITGLLARGLEPMAAAEIGAWLHVEAARHFGPGLIAEDLPEALPAVLRALLP